MKHAITSVLATAISLAVLAPASHSQDRMGSIYRPNRGPQGLISNKTARRPGDLVTVIINEKQDISNQETADIQRETSLSYELLNFDLKPNAFNVLPAVSSETEDGLVGRANYQKAGDFNARITAIVIDVLPNGNMVINGRREIRVDREVKTIEFTGIVRRYDILANNTIQSELVANANISYSGKGPLTNATNRRGLSAAISGFFQWLWPF